MDAPCTYAEFRACMRDLERVNRLTRGYQPTLAFLDRVLAANGAALPQPLRILDIGCGGGDTLRHIARWARKRGIAVELTGIDLNPRAIRAASAFSAATPDDRQICFTNEDVFHYEAPQGIDVVLSALFTHHLSTPDVVRFLDWMEQHARLGWFINDLRRSRRAAWWFRALPVLFRWHRFIRHDGPVSLRRAFVPADWARILDAAAIPADARIEAHSMSRLCVARLRMAGEGA
jgi:SAM-dependent methyltransferase